jgi:P-type Cu+ transporter
MTDRTYSFEVQGMSCASCVARVEKALAAVPGTTFAAVNLASARATVGGEADPQAVHDALARAGYPVAVTDVTLDVHQMTCASCVARVEKALKAVPGVLDATANLAQESATVRCSTARHAGRPRRRRPGHRLRGDAAHRRRP